MTDHNMIYDPMTTSDHNMIVHNNARNIGVPNIRNEVNVCVNVADNNFVKF